MSTQNATADQIRKALAKKIHELKQESHNAVNVYKCKEILCGILDVVEVMLTGRATLVQPNVVPGLPIGQDPNKQHVEFFKTDEQRSQSGDIEGGGQRVEFFPTPQATPQEPIRSADATAGQIVPGAATRNIEAGRGEEVPMLPGQIAGQGQSTADLISALPIPVLEA